MREFNASNTGNRVVINCASTQEVLNLKRVIVNEIKSQPLGVKLIGSSESIFDKDIDFSGVIEFIKNTVLSLDGSEAFIDAIFACLRHCTYKSTYKIDMALFDNPQVPEAREDYYEIIVSCVEENLRPFMKSLISSWKILTQSDLINQLLNQMS